MNFHIFLFYIYIGRYRNLSDVGVCLDSENLYHWNY